MSALLMSVDPTAARWYLGMSVRSRQTWYLVFAKQVLMDDESLLGALCEALSSPSDRVVLEALGVMVRAPVTHKSSMAGFLFLPCMTLISLRWDKRGK